MQMKGAASLAHQCRKTRLVGFCVILCAQPALAASSAAIPANPRGLWIALALLLAVLAAAIVIFWKTYAHSKERIAELERQIVTRICIERQLQASQSNLQMATETLGLGTWYWELQNDQIFCSTETRCLLNLPEGKDVFSSTDFFTVVHPDDQDRLREAIEKGTREKGAFTTEYRIILPGGGNLWVAGYARALPDPSGEVARIAGIVIDVTDRKLLEERLQHARKMEAVGRLAGGIAHDFNNVLGVISAYSELLLEDSSLPPATTKRVQEIMDATQRANALTRQLLTFSRKQVIAPAVLNLNDAVHGLTSMMQRLVGEDIVVESKVDAGLPCIKADRGHIEQMLLNFAANSRDAMPRGGKFRIQTSRAMVPPEDAPLPQGEYVHLEVSDTGCGMSQEVLERIFEPFFTTKAVGRGTGLGLATVYGVVDQSGGHISVKSKLNHGTTFHVYLPTIAEVHTKETVKETRSGEFSGSILLVEDEAALRGVLAEFLQSTGLQVVVAEDGLKALAILEKGPRPDVLLTDLVMPNMDGNTLAHKARELLPGLRVIYMSGHTDDNLLRRDLLHQGLPYLQKPFSRTQLMIALETAFAPEPDAIPSTGEAAQPAGSRNSVV